MAKAIFWTKGVDDAGTLVNAEPISSGGKRQRGLTRVLERRLGQQV
jgi:hypothetical protein